MRRQVDMAGGISTSRTRRIAQMGRLAGGQGARHLAIRATNFTRTEEQQLKLLERRQLDFAEQLVNLLGTMRGAAMKLGQSLSIVDFGLVPESHREQFQQKLAALQDRAPNVPWRKMQRQLESGLQDRIDNVFESFDQTPVGAASIGQVYKARLHTGQAVAVKVQYPGIATAVRSDIKNLRMFAKPAQAVIPGIDLESIIAEVEERVYEELDYELEAQNHRLFARHYRGHPFIRVPEVHTELCSDTVLVTDWLDGQPLNAAESLDQDARNRVAEIIFRFYIGGPFELLAFSGDPHPGNSLLLADGTVGFIDFGLLKRIDHATAELERRGGRAIANEDIAEIIDCFAEQKIVFDRERISDELLLDALLKTEGWFLEDDEIELTPELTNLIAAYATDLRGPVYRIFKHQQLPPAHMVQRRVEIQVLSILGQLRPIVNWHRIAREWLFGDPPQTELGRQARQWRENGRNDAVPTAA
ncbi:MAG TPA: AarF/ABC1/UbiB kinase family protein [Solirubrobacteraceae bacterium]|jgi:predicted unusual protein kinase regulating ubiquinone biosynthesis (AarF/ABC1/UbiB family)|nr:AarF/ABC1/UbiB kinase family protein [Solirubrobacteraceae bacterium]